MKSPWKVGAYCPDCLKPVDRLDAPWFIGPAYINNGIHSPCCPYCDRDSLGVSDPLWEHHKWPKAPIRRVRPFPWLFMGRWEVKVPLSAISQAKGKG